MIPASGAGDFCVGWVVGTVVSLPNFLMRASNGEVPMRIIVLIREIFVYAVQEPYL